jgi:nitrogen regulatory protein P-II 2
LASTGHDGHRGHGYGRRKGHTAIYRGAKYELKFVPNVKIEAAVAAALVDRAVEAMQNAAKTGQAFVSPIEQAVRIRTG